MTITRKASRWLAALLGAAVIATATEPMADDAHPTADPAGGQLLVASDAIKDPRFHHSVILIVRHDHNGAFGVMINRPLGERSLAEILAAAGDDGGKGGEHGADGSLKGTVQIFRGGPVQPDAAFVVHSDDYRRAETLAVASGVMMTATKEVLRDIGHRRGPAKYLFTLGYAGWGAGQLEAEIARHDWFTEPATPDLVFDAKRADVWDKAIARRTREL